MLNKGQLALWAAVLALAVVSAYNFTLLSQIDKKQSFALDAVKGESEKIDKAIQGFNEQIESIRRETFSNSINISMISPGPLNVNTGSRAFDRLLTNNGLILIAVEDVQQYPGGYRLVISIGNTTSQNIVSSKIKLRWGGWLIGNGNRDNPKEKSFSITKNIAAGAWTKMNFDIAPASEEEISTVSIEMFPGTVSLRE